MKTQYLKIMILAGIAVVLVAALPTNAQGKGPGKPCPSENKQDCPLVKHPLTEEGTDRMLSRLKEVDPNKAAELEKLRATDPNAFKAELRTMMRERFKNRILLRDANVPLKLKGETFRERARERGQEYLEWLKANYPEEANRLAELQKGKPELYKRQLWLGARKYGRIVEASTDNPELAKVLKQDLELRNQTFDILRKIKASTDEAEKQKLIAELEKITSEKFDVVLQRKQMEYDQMRKELERLTEHVKQNEAQLEKWKANKADRVKERVKKLLSRDEEFEW